VIDRAIQTKKYKDCLEFTNECLYFYYNTNIPVGAYEIFGDNYGRLIEWSSKKDNFYNSNVAVCVKNNGLNIGFIRDNLIFLLIANNRIISLELDTANKIFDEVLTFSIKEI